MKEFYWGPFCRSIMCKVGRLWGECFQSSCPILPKGGTRTHTHALKLTRERKEKSRARRMKSEDVITGLPANGDKPSAAALKKALALPRPARRSVSFPLSRSLPSCLFLLSAPLQVPPLTSADKNTSTHLCPPAVNSPPRGRDSRMVLSCQRRRLHAPLIKPFQVDRE